MKQKRFVRTLISLVMIASLFASFGLTIYADNDNAAEEISEEIAEVVEPVEEPAEEISAEETAGPDETEATAEVTEPVEAEEIIEAEEITEAEVIAEAEETAEAEEVIEAAAESEEPAEAIEAVQTEEAEEIPSQPAAYEVDFAYNGQTFVLQGDSSSNLDVLLADLGVSGSVAAVSSSNPDLFSCEQVDGVWVVSAKNGFTSAESLSITFEDGTVLDLNVNDDFAGNSSGLIMCVYDEETQTLTIKLADDAEIPELFIEGESAEDRLARLSQYAVQDLGGQKGLLRSLRNDVKTLVIEEGVTGIGWDENRGKSWGVFQEFSALTCVKTCSTLVNIGFSAFRKCLNLTDFDFESCVNLETMRQQAFSVTAIEEADLSNTQLTVIDSGVFACDAPYVDQLASTLKTVSLPSTVTVIYDNAFDRRDSIESITYDAAHYDHSVLSNGGNKVYLSSNTFKASTGYTVNVGSDVEYLPEGFFKAFNNTDQDINFLGRDDNDPDTVSARVVELEEGAINIERRYTREPYYSFPSSIIVDETGVVYEAAEDGLRIIYFSPSVSQYVLPESVSVNGEAIAVNAESISAYADGQTICKLSYSLDPDNSREDLTIDGELPAFRTSSQVFIVNSGADEIASFSSDDLLEISYTGTAADGARYRYDLIGWIVDGEEIELGAVLKLDGDKTLSPRWAETKIDEPENGEEAAPAAAEQIAPAPAELAAPAAAPAAPAVHVNAQVAPAVHVNAQAEAEAEAETGIVETIVNEAVPMAAPQQMQVSAPGSAETLSPAASAAAEISGAGAAVLVLIAVLVAAAFVIILVFRKNRKEQA